MRFTSSIPHAKDERVENSVFFATILAGVCHTGSSIPPQAGGVKLFLSVAKQFVLVSRIATEIALGSKSR